MRRPVFFVLGWIAHAHTCPNGLVVIVDNAASGVGLACLIECEGGQKVQGD
ncbi:hypothetical protein BRCON_2025 [Candidatus Sumerlaea chitinivorans]|uniref:Uncharacterized protein n=1 Tax=Sumerlaea chitinivorans TaxID=2250252 RepID=A0A2Z4Y821_SUMC1|nr:hypothetical protein BRCON_2025 [Candidatus Sumerlaea chitinivorans]